MEVRSILKIIGISLLMISCDGNNKNLIEGNGVYLFDKSPDSKIISGDLKYIDSNFDHFSFRKKLSGDKYERITEIINQDINHQYYDFASCPIEGVIVFVENEEIINTVYLGCSFSMLYTKNGDKIKKIGIKKNVIDSFTRLLE